MIFSEEGAYNGDEAIKKLPVAKPDLILLDIVLPEVDGLSFLKTIRQPGGEFARVPVIVLTNLPDTDGIKSLAAMKLKVGDYIVKTDYSLEKLDRKIKEVLHI